MLNDNGILYPELKNHFIHSWSKLQNTHEFEVPETCFILFPSLKSPCDIHSASLINPYDIK
jgi:hypothetical protein